LIKISIFGPIFDQNLYFDRNLLVFTSNILSRIPKNTLIFLVSGFREDFSFQIKSAHFRRKVAELFLNNERGIG